MIEREIAEGKRFEFGENWKKFLSVLDAERIFQAELSLKQMIGAENLNGKSFLDVGSGSGLFSLAARRLGARVYSFDYDPQSVACTSELRKRYFPNDEDWHVERGSVLDTEYLKSLGEFDIVYSWGVLHHTGNMWQALDNVQLPIKAKGTLYIAIYDDQGIKSLVWLKIKQIYCSGIFGKTAILSVYFPFFILKGFAADLLHFRNPIVRYTKYKTNRGMSLIRDIIDWLGGYPYEFAKPEAVCTFYKERRFSLVKINIDKTVNKGLNEFIFIRE